MGSGIPKFPLDVDIDDRLPGPFSLLRFEKIMFASTGEKIEEVYAEEEAWKRKPPEGVVNHSAGQGRGGDKFV